MEEAPVIRTTVLFVSHNAIELLRRSLASVEAAQDRASIEIIVVDNGSTDGSAQLDSDFPAASFLRLPKNFGHTKALNIGIRTAKGEFVLIAEPGAEFPGNAIGRMVSRLESDTDAAAVCPRISCGYYLPAPDELFAEWKGARVLREGNAGADAAEYVRHTPILVRRTFLAGMRYLDERFGDAGWELDLCRQIRKAGKRIAVLPEVEIPTEDTPPDASRLAKVDQLNAVAVYAAKYYGFGAALKIRFAAAMAALLHFDISSFTGIVSGRKIDGEQSGA